MIHGAPGVGKSTVKNAFLRVATICKRFKFKISFNSINAAEMAGYTTSAKIQSNPKVHMNHLGSFSAEAIKELRDMGFQQDSIITIEEFENNAPWHLARLSRLCQMANDNDKPFGGCFVFLIGDLGQLDPVQAGPNLTQAVMDVHLADDLRPRAAKRKFKIGETILPSKRPKDARYNRDHPYWIGQWLLTNACWYELTEQQRSGDEGHNEVVHKTYRGETITFEDLKNRNYRILSDEDGSQEDWLRAPVLVTTNRERFTIAIQRARNLASFLGKPVIRWQSETKRWRNKPSSAYEYDVTQDPCLHDIFVQDADGFLCDNYMPHLRLVNGTRIKYRSLVFEPEHRSAVEVLLEGARPGEVIDIPFRPIAVVVDAFMPDECEKPILEALRSFSIGRSRNVVTIPIFAKNSRWTSRGVPIPGGLGYGPSSVYVKSCFPLEASFAMTVYKALGRTIDRVILALSGNKPAGCNWTYRQVHVALSRVRTREHIRLLLVGSSETEKWHSLSYLQNLKPDPSIAYFFAGFRSYNERNPNVNWQCNTWSADRANDWFRQQIS
jgi:hypothetical protein